MNIVESIPEARLLLASLRSVGYSEETAIADIIDNCISAQAHCIKVLFDWESQRIVIADDGEGMLADELFENMRIGSSDPDKSRDSNDLGRFGMGMKTAAFSLGKKLTVVSKKDGIICNACWDLDRIPEIGWNLIVEKDDVLLDLFDLLDSHNGTIVVIEKLDRIVDKTQISKSKKHFFGMINRVHKHIGLVFHRFMIEDNLKIMINENEVIPWDPFVLSNSATQELAEEYVWSEESSTDVYIQPYVLPHKTKFSSEDDYNNAGGPKGWNYHQGVYVYRNRRLIICGTWFDYIKKEPAYNLARIKVDISSDGDSDWKIDIKKSTASLPIYAKEALERAIERCTDVSARVYNSRGTYTKSNVVSPNLNYVWEQRKRNGKYFFHINKKHILLEGIKKQLDKEGNDSLTAYLALVENFAPFVQSGLADTIPASESHSSTLEKEVEMKEICDYIAVFKDKGFTADEIKSTLLEMSSYRHLKNEILLKTKELLG